MELILMKNVSSIYCCDCNFSIYPSLSPATGNLLLSHGMGGIKASFPYGAHFGSYSEK